MDVRPSAEQRALRDSVAAAVGRLGPRSVADLDDAGRRGSLEAAVETSGWRELRAPGDRGGPLASAVEAGIVAEELGRGLADVSFVGPTLAAELRRIAGVPPARRPETVAFVADLSTVAGTGGGTDTAPAVAVDAAGCEAALVLVRRDGGWGLSVRPLGARCRLVDLTRPSAIVPVAAPVGSTGIGETAETGAIDEAGLARWNALGLSLACADLVGAMRGALQLATDYATGRRQFGAAIGSFQAVRHLLADALVAVEGSASVALHAGWAADALHPTEALTAAAVAKAYCARAARHVCETAIQVHGGIGNTWDCLAHVYLRRTLSSIDLLGGVGASLDRVVADRIVAEPVGVGRGLR